MQAQALADLINRTLTEYKAIDVQTIEIGHKSSLADYFVIASGNSDQQVRGLADLLEQDLAKQGIVPKVVEGYDTKHWILIDYVDVIVHLFQAEDREFYNLEKLWLSRPSLENN